MEKPKLLFVCNWGKTIKNKWSGTPYFLYCQLRHLFDVSNYNLIEKKRRTYLRIIKKVFKVRSSEIFELKMMQENRKRFSKDFPVCRMPVLQFNECINDSKYSTYIFQDLCVLYLLYLYDNNHDVFIKSGFDSVPIKIIRKRAMIQNEYYHNSCKGIFVMGDWLRDFMVNKCNISPKLVHSVGGGVNIDINKIDYSMKTGKRVLFAGRDFDRKAGLLVCNAFKVLRMKYMSDAELYIIGPKRKHKCMDSEGIYYFGRCDFDSMAYYYNMCDLLCVPSYFEAYGLVFPEALCFGLPCIGRNAYAMKEIIKDGENGYLIDKDDVDILAEKMYALLNNPTIQKSVRNNREYYINKYSWFNVATKMSEVICEQ